MVSEMATEVMLLLHWQVAGKVQQDLRPVNGATTLACGGVALLMEVTVADETSEDVVAFFFPWLLKQVQAISLRGLLGVA